MPVLKHYMGNCHVYVDRAANLMMAQQIIINAKCQRPGVCKRRGEPARTCRRRSGVSAEGSGGVDGASASSCADVRRLAPWCRYEACNRRDHAAEFLDLSLSQGR